MKPGIKITLFSALAISAILFAPYGHAQAAETHRSTWDWDELARVNQQAFTAGTPIYKGSTYPLDASTEEPLFHYERHVLDVEDGLVATHRTYDRTGALMQSETAWLSARYDVRQLVLTDHQRAVSGEVRVDAAAGTLTFSVRENGRSRNKTERYSLPLVTGASLFGYIVQHWDALAAGENQRVRFIVLPDLTTYGFTISVAAQQDGQVVFNMTPSNALVRLIVAPMAITFDAASRQVVRFEGRVPPLDNRTEKLSALDARVEYQALQPFFR